MLTDGDGTHAIQLLARPPVLHRHATRASTWPPVTELRRADDGKLVCELERAD